MKKMWSAFLLALGLAAGSSVQAGDLFTDGALAESVLEEALSDEAVGPEEADKKTQEGKSEGLALEADEEDLSAFLTKEDESENAPAGEAAVWESEAEAGSFPDKEETEAKEWDDGEGAVLLFPEEEEDLTAQTDDTVMEDSAGDGNRCGENLTYSLSVNGVLTVSGSGPMTDYDGISPFRYIAKKIKAIVVEDGVTTIGSNAFFYCEYAESLSIGNDVVSIGHDAFSDCTSLKSLTNGNSLKIIGARAFQRCYSLTRLILPNQVTVLEKDAFDACKRLTEVKLPDTLTTLGKYAFLNCNLLTEIQIPPSVKTIDEQAVGYYVDGLFGRAGDIVKTEGFTIYGYPGTKAQQYADENGFKFVSLRKIELEDTSGRVWKDILVTGRIYDTQEPDPEKITWVVLDKGEVISSYTAGTASVSEGAEQDAYSVSCPFQFDNGGTYNVRAYYEEAADTCEVKAEDYFVVGEDSNQFYHTGIYSNFSPGSEYEALLKRRAGIYFGTVNAILMAMHHDSIMGVCHGISLSMCMGQQNLLNFGQFKSNAKNYWELGDMADNPRFRDLVLYCQMLQNSDRATKSVEYGWFLKDRTEKKKKEFLKALVEEAEYGMENRIPFVFKYGSYGNVAHSVVICGYRWNSRSNLHELRIYDMNTYGGASAPGVYVTMTVSADFSSFSYTDHTKKISLESLWDEMKFYGCSYIQGGVSLPDSDRGSLSADTGRTEVMVSAFKPFRLTNAGGQWISYDGSSYDGTMPVYENNLIDMEGEGAWRIVTNASESFTLTDCREECALLCSFGGQCLGVIAGTADQVLLSAGSVKMDGEQIDCQIFHSRADGKIQALKLSGEGTVSVQYEDKTVVRSEKELKSLVESEIDGLTVSEKEAGEQTVSVICSGSEDEPDPDDGKAEAKTGDTVLVNGACYRLTGKNTVAYQKPEKLKKSVRIPNSVTIGGKSFRVTEIAASAFRKNRTVKKIVIGKYVAVIGKGAFMKAKNLKKIVVSSTRIKKIGKKAFKGTGSRLVIRVPKKKTDAYRKMLRASGFTGKLKN